VGVWNGRASLLRYRLRLKAACTSTRFNSLMPNISTLGHLKGWRGFTQPTT
jgi:hypothetical protein